MKRSATPLPSGWRCEGGRALDPEERDLVLEVAGHVVRAVVVAEREALGDVPPDGAEVAQDALAHRLERLEAVAGAGGMAADAHRRSSGRPRRRRAPCPRPG